MSYSITLNGYGKNGQKQDISQSIRDNMDFLYCQPLKDKGGGDEVDFGDIKNRMELNIYSSVCIFESSIFENLGM